MSKTPNRVAGGTSFADAMRNTSADTKTYVEIWIEKILQKYEPKKHVNYFVGTEEFIILFADNIVIRETFAKVEELRCESYNAFEDWFTNLLKTNYII